MNANEWDFRPVTERELRVAIEYEYAREGHKPGTVREFLASTVPQYPKPWLSLTKAARDRVTATEHIPSIHLRPMNSEFIERVSNLNGEFGYHMFIWWKTATIAQIVSDFETWVRTEAKRQKRNVHGKASAPPWHKLKQLAAKRLHDDGMNFQKAQDYIEQNKRSVQSGGGDVWPCYGSPGAWHDAVKAARAEALA